MNPTLIAHSDTKQVSWWNPAIGGINLPRLLGFPQKQKIAQTSICLHNQAFEQVKKIGIILESWEDKFLGNPEFLLLVKLRNDCAAEVGEFAGLKQSITLFKLAVELQDEILKIGKIESLATASQQKQLYNFISALLEKKINRFSFCKKVHQKFNEILQQVTDENVKKQLKSYINILDSLIQEHQLGLQLLCLRKKSQCLKQIGKLIQDLKEQDLQNIDNLINLVEYQYDNFTNLGGIIGIPAQENSPKTYALILQYLALRYKYQTIYCQFKTFKKLLFQWEQCYRIVAHIRYQHPPTEYEQPKEFKRPLQGLNVYTKYKGESPLALLDNGV